MDEQKPSILDYSNPAMEDKDRHFGWGFAFGWLAGSLFAAKLMYGFVFEELGLVLGLMGVNTVVGYLLFLILRSTKTGKSIGNKIGFLIAAVWSPFTAGLLMVMLFIISSN